MLSITTVFAPALSTLARTRCANSPGESSAALLDVQSSWGLQRLQVDIHCLHAREQQSQFLIEDEHRSLFAAPNSGSHELHDQQRSLRRQ
jgi:hypothetical protein